MEDSATDLKDLSRFTDFATLLAMGDNPLSSVQAIAHVLE